MASLFGYCQKKIIKKTFPAYIFGTFQIKNKYINKISIFYKLLNHLKKKKTKIFLI